MIIAITNDDSYSADGIQALVDILQEIPGVKTYLIAPKHHMSAKGTSLTIGSQISFEAYRNGSVLGYVIDGTPCDSVLIGLSLLKNDGVRPDLIISGINAGSNCGMDTHYSGTLGAAKQAVIEGIPAIAMSNLFFRENKETMVSRLGPTLVNMIKTINLDEMQSLCQRKQFLNVNFPQSITNGFKWCRLSDALLFHVHPEIDVGAGLCSYTKYHRSEESEQCGDDFEALQQGYVAVSVYNMKQHQSAAAVPAFATE